VQSLYAIATNSVKLFDSEGKNRSAIALRYCYKQREAV